MNNRTLANWLQIPLKALLVAVIFIYRYLISPILHMLAPGSGCRFQPTCSDYALQAVRTHGPLMGSWLAMKRIARCHPWGGHGYDPVPNGCSCTRHHDPQHPSSFDSARLEQESSHSQSL